MEYGKYSEAGPSKYTRAGRSLTLESIPKVTIIAQGQGSTGSSGQTKKTNTNWTNLGDERPGSLRDWIRKGGENAPERTPIHLCDLCVGPHI